MKYYRKTSHTVFDAKAQIVWITKIQKKSTLWSVAEHARELIRKVRRKHGVEILSGHIGKDHVRLLVLIPPFISKSKLVQYIKGNSLRKLMQEFKGISKAFWSQYLWGRGYSGERSGNVTDEVIMEHINTQGEAEEFNVEDGFSIE